MKQVFVLLLFFVFTNSYAQQVNLSEGMSSTQMPVVVDPLLQSYQAIMELPNNEIDKSSYLLGFGDVITIVMRGRYPMILKSHVLTASMDVYLPKLGFVSLKGTNIYEAERAIQTYVGSEVGETRVEISVEIPRMVQVEIAEPEGHIQRLKLPANTTLITTLLEAQKLKEFENSSLPLDTRRPMTMADNVFLKAPQVQTQLSAKNLNNEGLLSESDFQVFDYLAYNFDVRKLEIHNLSDSVTYYDYFSDWLIDDIYGSPSQLNSQTKIYLKSNKSRSSVLSLMGDVTKAFRVPVRVDDPIETWLSKEMTDDHVANVSFDDYDEVQFNDLSDLINAINGAIHKQIKAINVKLTRRETFKEIDGKSGYWFYESKLQQYQFIDQELHQQISESKGEYHFFLFRNALWNRDIDDIESILIRAKADVLEGELDYLDFISSNTAVIPIAANSLPPSFRMPEGYILVGIPKKNEVKLIGPFVQEGNYEHNSESVDWYISESGGLSKAATGKVFIIKSGTYAWYDSDKTKVEPGDIIYAERKPIDNFIIQRNLELEKLALYENRRRTWISLFGTVLSAVTTIILITRN